MKLYCVNTLTGLVPCGDDDYDQKKRLSLGQVYLVEIKLSRNYPFLKKYFALIRCAWEYLSEAQQEFFGYNVTTFRKAVEVAAGWFDLNYNINRDEWYQAPKSIAFDSMNEEEFSNLYDSVKDVLFQTYLTNISKQDFLSNLINF